MKFLLLAGVSALALAGTSTEALTFVRPGVTAFAVQAAATDQAGGYGATYGAPGNYAPTTPGGYGGSGAYAGQGSSYGAGAGNYGYSGAAPSSPSYYSGAYSGGSYSGSAYSGGSYSGGGAYVSSGDYSAGSYGSVRPVFVLAFKPTGVDIGAIPEPSTWSMMLSGFGFLGYCLRRRLTRVRPA